KEAEKIRVVYKNIMMDEWAIYKVEIENRIKTGDVKIQELKFRKDFPENKNKFNRQITRLEKRNNDLRKKMDNYHEEVKAKWEKFKVSMANDIDGVAIELKDVTLDNKKKDK
ncbi:MAG: hypothetical protein NTX03_06025, partial [Bacteroidetes bacterium]|nr:hypothetical protein [Bacteroidota bacterium]